jgi:hypothetical protein
MTETSVKTTTLPLKSSHLLIFRIIKEKLCNVHKISTGNENFSARNFTANFSVI